MRRMPIVTILSSAIYFRFEMVALLSQTGILFDERQAYLSVFAARFQLWIGFHEELRRLIDEFLEDLRCLSWMRESDASSTSTVTVRYRSPDRFEHVRTVLAVEVDAEWVRSNAHVHRFEKQASLHWHSRHLRPSHSYWVCREFHASRERENTTISIERYCTTTRHLRVRRRVPILDRRIASAQTRIEMKRFTPVGILHHQIRLRSSRNTPPSRMVPVSSFDSLFRSVSSRPASVASGSYSDDACCPLRPTTLHRSRCSSADSSHSKPTNDRSTTTRSTLYWLSGSSEFFECVS